MGPSPSSPMIDPPERDERAHEISLLVYEFLSRKNQGEPVEPREYELSHPELMPELRRALHGGIARLRNVIDAERAKGDGDDKATADGAKGAHVSNSYDNQPWVRGYRLIQQINGGGQGEVYEAVHEVTGRIVALKLVTSISKNTAARFEREVQALARVSHSGIVGVIDRGRTGSGSYYLTMEYVAGRDLDEWLVSYHQSPGANQKEVLRVFAQIAAALGAAHEKSIVHRDLKPSNIRIDQQGEPKVVDFGLAYLMENEDVARRQLTMTGNIVGSIPWASPEQAEGAHGKLSPASDVYSLGVLLYHALTGEFPYDVSAPLHAVTYNICKRPPSNPAKHDHPKFGLVDRTLASVVLKCLAKSPMDRYRDGSALSEVITSYLNGTLPHSSRRASVQRWLSAVIVLVAMIATFTMWKHFQQPTPLNEVLVTPLPRFTNAIGMIMVQMPRGEFRMGSPTNEIGHQDDEESHTVELTQPFYIAATEVTRKQYRSIIGALPAGVGDGADDLPIDHISWDDANTFCRALSKRDGRSYALPTEAQWEYACRAGTSRPFAGTGDAKSMSWCRENSDGHLHPVATRSPNHWGLYDMQGNAAEWVRDNYVPFLGSAERRDPIHILGNPMGSLRGGNFSDPAVNCRAAARSARSRSIAEAGNGFRVVSVSGAFP